MAAIHSAEMSAGSGIQGSTSNPCVNGRAADRDVVGRSAGSSFPLAFGRTPAVVTEVALWRFVEVDLCEAQHLVLIDMVDVDTHVSHQLRRDIWAMLFDVRHPLVRRVGLAFAMTEDEDRSGGSELLGDLVPVSSTVVLVGPRWVPGFVVDLVEPPVRIGSDNAIGSHTGFGISGVYVRVAKGNDGDHVLAPNELCILVNHQTSVPFSSNYPTARS